MTRPRGTRPPAHALLERRYRRLLALYPAAYRAANEDEMLGVAMSRAAPDQRRPGRGEAASLIASGIRMRFGLLLPGLRAPAWRESAAVFGIFGPILLAAIHAESLVGQLTPEPFVGAGRLSAADMVLTAGWSLAAGATVLRWRRIAAAGASLAAIGEAAHMAVRYFSAPPFVVASWWQLALAIMTVLAAVTVAACPESGKQSVPGWVIAAVTAIAALLVAFPAIESAFTTVTLLNGGGASVSNPMFGAQDLLKKGLFAVLAITLLGAVARMKPAARRRVVAQSVPVAAAGVLSAWGAGRFLAPGPLWVALGALPVLSFAAGMALISRHERMLRLVGAGERDAA
jgi:hypothetical protein